MAILRYSVTDHWHVVRVWSGQESFVADQLTKFDGFVPLYRNPLNSKVLPFISGYVFARWDGDNPYLWHEIRNVNYVFGFIGEPWPVDVIDPIVDQWFREAGFVTLDEKRKHYLRGFGKGDLLILKDGSWLDGHVGVCVWTDDVGAKIKIGLLGRDQEVYRKFSELVPISAVPEQDSENKRKQQRRRRQVHSAWPRQTRMMEVS